jgi:BirA family biotin operon repressor/biotin-[acetyl-CoA-carboxylase] ligase
VPANISADRFQEGLRTKRFGKEIFFSHEAGSTNDWAKELALLDAPEGTVTVAETQTAGRGRLSRVWFSPRGGLYFSVILRPELKPAEAVRLVFVASLVIADVLRELYGVGVETKWPNDVLVNGRKVCGILSEASIMGEAVNFVVVGVGVNANFDVKEALPEALWENTTSLQSEVGRKIQLEALFRAILERLESCYDLFLKEGFAPVLEKWKRYAGFLGSKVEVLNETEHLMGIALNVEADGSLTVKLEDGTVKRVLVGDVSLAVLH